MVFADQSKAFERLSWGWLRRVLEDLGTPPGRAEPSFRSSRSAWWLLCPARGGGVRRGSPAALAWA
eukprot:3663526-Alexandrium_andersonii.AAC.1